MHHRGRPVRRVARPLRQAGAVRVAGPREVRPVGHHQVRELAVGRLPGRSFGTASSAPKTYSISPAWRAPTSAAVAGDAVHLRARGPRGSCGRTSSGRRATRPSAVRRRSTSRWRSPMNMSLASAAADSSASASVRGRVDLQDRVGAAPNCCAGLRDEALRRRPSFASDDAGPDLVRVPAREQRHAGLLAGRVDGVRVSRQDVAVDVGENQGCTLSADCRISSAVFSRRAASESAPTDAAHFEPVASLAAEGRRLAALLGPGRRRSRRSPGGRGPRASGEAIRALTANEPADSPKIVTLPGSPPKAAMLSCTHRSAATWSSRP